MRSRFVSSVAALAILAGSSVNAGTTSATFGVTAAVFASCNIGTVPTLPFGVYDPTTTSNTDSATSILLTCTPGTPYNISLNAGTTSGASVSQRRLQGVTALNKLNYNLYRDVSRTLVWGETVLSDTVPSVGTGSAQGHTVYGRISSGTSAGIDVYTDTITVTVTY